MDDWTNYIMSIAKDLLKKQTHFDSIEEQFEDIEKYCFGLSHNVLSSTRMSDNPEFHFNYDVGKWINSESKLFNFKHNVQAKLKFILTRKQNVMIQDKLQIFGNSSTGLLQTIKRIPRQNLWRIPICVNQ
jgi:hypothetical protein